MGRVIIAVREPRTFYHADCFMFYGIVVFMYFEDNRRHKKPHIPVAYQEHEAVISIPEGKLLRGSLPKAKLKLLSALVHPGRSGT